jgi:hypothetical protein
MVIRKLNHAVLEVVVNQILAYFLFSVAAIEDATEADNCRRAACGKLKK